MLLHDPLGGELAQRVLRPGLHPFALEAAQQMAADIYAGLQGSRVSDPLPLGISTVAPENLNAVVEPGFHKSLLNTCGVRGARGQARKLYSPPGAI